MMKDRRAHPRRDVLSDADRDRVEEVFLTHQRFIENVARQNAPGPDHVPDIVQAVGIQVCRGLNGYRGDAEIRTWLYRVTVNTARDYYRNEARGVLRPRQALTVMPAPEPVVDPDADLIAGERIDALHEAVERLKPLHRDVMRNDLSPVPVSSGRRTTRHRARRRLRQLLSDDPRLDP